MKGIRITEILSEIRVNLVAFISIAMFVCLGVAMFLGVTWASNALVGKVDDTMEAGQMHDLEVQYLYGLTESNLGQLRQTEGVSDVEPGYIAFARMIESTQRPVLKMQSLTKRIDLPTVLEGELPTKAGETALLSFWAKEHGLGIGDTIRLEHDATDKDDSDGIEYLTTDKLTITGLVDHPAFLSKVPGSLGGATIGSGDIDCAAFVTEDSFDKTKFDNAYPVAYLRSDSLRGMSTFSGSYKEALATLTGTVNGLGDGLAEKRFKEVHSSYDAKLAEAEKKIAEGDKALADGERDYADGQKEVDEGEKKIVDGEKELADGATKLDDAKQQLDDGEDQLADARRQLEEGEAELAEGEKKLAEAKDEAESKQASAEGELASAKKRLDDAQKEYDANEKDYADAKQSYDDASKTFEGVSGEYDAALASHEALKSDQGALDATIATFQQAADNYHKVNGDAAATPEAKEAAWAEVEKAYPSLADACNSTETDLNSLAQNMGAVVKAYDAPAPNVPKHDTIAELQRDNTDAVLQSARSEQEAANATLNDVDSTNVEVNGKTYNILQVRDALSDADERLNSARADLDAAKKELDDGKAKYNDAKSQYSEAVKDAEARIADAEEEIAAGRAELDEGWASYYSASDDFDRSLSEYNDALNTYKEKRAELEQGKVDLEEGKAELRKARRTLEEKKKELESAKADLQKARKSFDELVDYD